MKKESECSFQFRVNYLRLRDKGLSVSEIEKMYTLPDGYGYKLIRKLAEEMGVDHKTLLPYPDRSYTAANSVVIGRVKRSNFSEILDEIREGANEINSTLSRIDSYLMEWPVAQKLEEDANAQ